MFSPRTTVAQQMGQRADTTRRAPPDSLRRPGATQGPPARAQGQRPGRGAGPGQSSAGVQFSARDSLVVVMPADSSDRGALYGQSTLSYQGATLEANKITMNFETSLVRATGAPSDSGQSRPVFRRTQGSRQRSGPSSGQPRSFTGKALEFNLDTKRGRVVVARTEQRSGYIEGDAVKVYEDSTLFVRGGSYTTCDCPPGQTPSYSLRSSEMKVKDRWVYTGPINLYLFNIPTPLWLPFGFLPNVSGRRSGPLPPEYGQDPNRGLYLRDWGWYFALNDYTDLQLRASVWSKGSFEVNPIFRYTKRYRYDGDIDLTYQRRRIGEPEDPDFTNEHSGRLQWNHAQELSPSASIRGDIDLATSSDFARENSNTYNDAVRQEISSNVSYRKNWPGGKQNLSVSASQRQQLNSGEVSMTLPSLNFRQGSFKPFNVDQAVGDERWFEKITTSYRFSVQNRYSYTPRTGQLRSQAATLRQRGDSTAADSLEQVADSVATVPWYEAVVDRQKYRFATGQNEPFDFQASHRIPLNASFYVNRYNLSITPRVSYSSDWHISTTRRFLRRDTKIADGDTSVVEESIERTVPGFYARRRMSTGVSASTELYGLFPIEVGPFEGIRHRMASSVSFNYSPNFNDPFWGRTRVLRYENGEPVLDEETNNRIRYDILGGNTVRRSNEQRSLNFSLNNELETKHVRVDSTGEEQTDKIKLLDFDLGASYNFARENFKMSDIDLGARTTIQDFRINTSMTFSPYTLQPQEPETGSDTSSQATNPDVPIDYVRADRYMIRENPLTPVRLTNFRVNVSGSFQSSNRGGQAAGAGQQGARSGSRRRRGQVPAGVNQRRPPQSAASGQNGQNTSRPSANKGYLDSSMPWSLNFSFSYSLSKPGRRVERQRATINGSFSLEVTPMWSLRGRTGYDFIDGKLSTTSINVSRDLGCWTMSFRWVPFGRYQSYGFNLQVKSGKLSQLLRLQIPNSGGENRLGGFGNRLQGAVGGMARGGGRSLRF